MSGKSGDTVTDRAALDALERQIAHAQAVDDEALILLTQDEASEIASALRAALARPAEPAEGSEWQESAARWNQAAHDLSLVALRWYLTTSKPRAIPEDLCEAIRAYHKAAEESDRDTPSAAPGEQRPDRSPQRKQTPGGRK